MTGLSNDLVMTILIRVGTQELRHRYMGGCPDYTQPEKRDPLCAACKAIRACEQLDTEREAA